MPGWVVECQGRNPAALQRPGSPWGLPLLFACSPGLLGTRWAGPSSHGSPAGWAFGVSQMQPPPSRRQRRMRSNRGGPGQALAFGRSAPVPAAGPHPASWGSPAVSRPLWVWCRLLSLNIQETKIMASSPITSWQTEGGKVETVTDFTFLGSKIIADGDCSHEIKRHLLFGRFVCDKPRQHIKKQRHHFANEGPYSQSYGFSSSHVWM